MLAIAPRRGIFGHSVYVRVPHAERAEVAVVVADDLHHLGLATRLQNDRTPLGTLAQQLLLTKHRDRLFRSWAYGAFRNHVTLPGSGFEFVRRP